MSSVQTAGSILNEGLKLEQEHQSDLPRVSSPVKQSSDSLEGREGRSGNINQPESSNVKQGSQLPASDNREYKSRSSNQASQNPSVQSLSQKQQASTDKILKNEQLFNAMRKNKTFEEKLKKVQKHLYEGADINARDANDKNNTPLHLAVLKGEPKIVQLLLDRGAIIDNKNADNETPLDIAKHLGMSDIIQILKTSFELNFQFQPPSKIIGSVDNIAKQENQPSSKAVRVSEPSSQQILQSSANIEKGSETQKKNSNDKSQEYEYSKRIGTSGISGQLYETKLAMLLLLRALNDKKVDSFFLGTNMDGIGALDDIIFRYKLNGQEKPRVIFIQAKHRDNPKSTPVTVRTVQTKGEDLSLDKYLESYLRIKQKFYTDDINPIFRKDKSKNIDYDIVIYTNANENFHKKDKIDPDYLLRTTETGKTFQFKYDNNDIDSLLETLAKSRIKLLAESFAKFIFSNKPNKYINMMSDELITSYHVVLAQKVIEVSKEVFKENKTKQDEYFRKGKFRDDFFSDSFADSNLLSIYRKALYEEAVHNKKILHDKTEIINLINQILENPTAETISKLIGSVLTYDAKSNMLLVIENKIPQEIIQLKDGLEKVEVTQKIIEKAIEIAGEDKLKSMYFKLPSTFGNLDLKIRGAESKKDKKIKHLTSKFIELLKNTDITSNNIVKIYDNIVGTDEILKDGDVEINGGIGGLVGNLLILDEETKMLKFNNNEESLSENAKQLFEKLKSKSSKDEYLKDKNLNSYRFEINVNGFPRLSLINEEYDKNLVKDFLNKLKFYTNQAKEDEVEEILKNEINKHYNTDQKKYEFSFRVKSDAIFIKVHDEVQKWWKQPKKSPFLTKSCNFFEQAKKDIIDSSLLTILNFMYINKVKENDIKFNHEAIQTLELDTFRAGPVDERIMNIITDENILTNIKLVQYFESKISNYHTFVDLDYVLRTGYYKNVISEFEESTLDILLIECKEHYNSRNVDENVRRFCKELKALIDNKSKSTKKIIFITKKNDILVEMLKKDFSVQCILDDDEKNSLINLTTESQNKCLEKRTVIFQGEEVSLDNLILDQESKHLITADVLSKLINNEKIVIGNVLPDLGEVKNYYINRTFNRQITIQKGYLEAEVHDLFAISNIKESELSGLIHVNKDDNLDKRIRRFRDNDPDEREPIRFIILENENARDNFRRLCDDYPNYTIHWLKQEESNKLIWQESHGVLSNLRKYLYCQDNKHIETYVENELINNKNDRKIVIIAAEPGMGKSTLLTNLAKKIKECDSSVWVVRINLFDLIGKNLNKIDFKKDDAVEFLVNALNLKDKTLGKNLFLYRLNKQGGITFLLDGFDEISSNYKEKVIDLLKIIKETQTNRIFVSTRGYMQNKLEDAFSTLSYTLKPFSLQDQKDFLRKIWQKQFNLNHLTVQQSMNRKFEKYSDNLLESFSQSILDKKKEITGIPLLIEMLANNHESKFKDFLNSEKHELSNHLSQEKFDLLTLYEDFIEKKHNRYHLIKLKKNKEEPGITGEVKTLKGSFINDHKLLAMQRLFSKDQLKFVLTDIERRQIQELMKKIVHGEEKTGIVNKIIEDKPDFIHLSFAEYFAAKLITDKLKSASSTEPIWEFIINTIFIKNHPNVRQFFNSILIKDQQLADLSSQSNHKEIVLKLLLQQKGYQKTSICVAAQENLVEIINMLLKSVCEDLDTLIKIINICGDNDPYILPLCLAVEHDHKAVVEVLLKYVKDVDAERLIEVIIHAERNLPLYLAVKSKNSDIVNILLKDIKDPDQIQQIINIRNDEDYDQTVLHIAASTCNIDILLKYIAKLKPEQCMEILITPDEWGRIPAHLAAEKNYFNFFHTLYTLLNKEQFTKVCARYDHEGYTPIDMFHMSAVSDDDYEKINYTACEFEALKMELYSYLDDKENSPY